MHAMLILVLVAIVVAAFFIPLLEKLADASSERDETRPAEQRRRQRF